MALPKTLCDREQGKFIEDGNGDTAVRTVIVASLPTPPTLNTVTPANQKNTLDWSAVGGATDYKIYWSTTSGVTTEDNEIITGSTSTTYEHTGLTNGTTYYYRVVAVGAWGDTLPGNEVSGTPEAFTNSLSTLLDGIDEFITFGDNHNYEINEAFTLSMWVKVTNLAGSRKTLWAKATNDANVDGWGWYIEATSGDLFVQARTTTVNRNYTWGSTGISAGTWHHIVLTYDGSSNTSGLTAYVDGASLGAASSQSLGGTILNSEDSQIGRRNSAFPLNANVDEVTWWGVEMSAAEVTELYNSGSPDDPSNHSQSANNQHWYKCGDGDTFPTWTDNAGSVDGTMTNMESGDFVSDTP